MNNGFIRYDTRLIERSRENRKNPTVSEQRAWEELFSKKQFFGYKFTRQKMLGGFIVDFYCSKLQLVVEIDGKIHDNQIEYDEERTIELQKLGLRVLRYTNEQILEFPERVMEHIKKSLKLENEPQPLVRG